MQSQIDTLTDRLARIEAELGRVAQRSELGFALARGRIAAELQVLKDGERT